MKTFLSFIGRRGVVMTLAVIGLAAGYMMGLSPEVTAQSDPAQTCSNSASCTGSNCTTKEACRKTGCGCDCNAKANLPQG